MLMILGHCWNLLLMKVAELIWWFWKWLWLEFVTVVRFHEYIIPWHCFWALAAPPFDTTWENGGSNPNCWTLWRRGWRKVGLFDPHWPFTTTDGSKSCADTGPSRKARHLVLVKNKSSAFVFKPLKAVETCFLENSWFNFQACKHLRRRAMSSENS